MKRIGLLIIFLSAGFSVSATSYPIIIDNCGKPVTFTHAPQRAVINDINMAEMAFALHLQDKIVGLTGITGWYKLTPAFRKAWVPFRNWRQNTLRWKH